MCLGVCEEPQRSHGEGGVNVGEDKEVMQAGKGQVSQGMEGPRRTVRTLGLYSGDRGKAVQGFKQRSDQT